MFYVIDNFYHIFSSLYAYRTLFLARGGEGQGLAALRQSRMQPRGKFPGRR
jgi:hypothetical protein